MGTKKEEPRNRDTFGEVDNGFKAPDIGCATDFSTTYGQLQERIVTKFAPKRKRAEVVAGLYQTLAERFEKMSGAEVIQAYLDFDKDHAFNVVWFLMHQYEGDMLFHRVRVLLSAWFGTHALSVDGCGTELEYHVTDTAAALVHANFCRDRLCPLCNWRRSLKVFGQVSQIMNVLDGRGYRYLFLTLTVRNVWGAELSDAVQALYDGWRVLYHDYIRGSRRSAEKRLKGIVVGTFRALEVTVSDGRYSPEWAGSFHPHLHVILAVEPSYFQRGHYLDKEDWRDLWRKACKLDYDPSIKIEAVRPKEVSGALDVPSEAGAALDYGGAVAELSKYPLKDADFVCDDKYSQPEGQYMSWLINALRRRRLLGLTGCFREVARSLKLDDMENGDLVNVDGGDADEAAELRDDVEYVVVKYEWHCGAYVQSVYIVGNHDYEPDETHRLTPEDLTPEAREIRRRQRKKTAYDVERGEPSDRKPVLLADGRMDSYALYALAWKLGYDDTPDFLRVAYGGKIRCLSFKKEDLLDLYQRVTLCGFVPSPDFVRWVKLAAGGD